MRSPQSGSWNYSDRSPTWRRPPPGGGFHRRTSWLCSTINLQLWQQTTLFAGERRLSLTLYNLSLRANSVWLENDSSPQISDFDVQSWVKPFVPRITLTIFCYPPQNCTMAQHFSQPFSEPDRNVFTRLCTVFGFKVRSVWLRAAQTTGAMPRGERDKSAAFLFTVLSFIWIL